RPHEKTAPPPGTSPDEGAAKLRRPEGHQVLALAGSGSGVDRRADVLGRGAADADLDLVQGRGAVGVHAGDEDLVSGTRAEREAGAGGRTRVEVRVRAAGVLVADLVEADAVEA